MEIKLQKRIKDKKVEDLIIKQAINLEGHCKNLKIFCLLLYKYEYLNNNATGLRLTKKKITLKN